MAWYSSSRWSRRWRARAPRGRHDGRSRERPAGRKAAGVERARVARGGARGIGRLAAVCVGHRPCAGARVRPRRRTRPRDCVLLHDSIQTMTVTPEEYERITRLLAREPTETELGIFSVMWSEHCSYKSSRIHLKKLPTKGARVLQGPGENAGAVDIGGGLAAVFKIESHNHPSFIEPYQGAATGVGGIIRDIFTMGARPIALLNALRFGPLTGEHGARTRRIMEGVVSGIAGYGNSIGIPTVGGEIAFEDPYVSNPLVNV